MTTGKNQWEHSTMILGRKNAVLRDGHRVYRLANHPSCGKWYDNNSMTMDNKIHYRLLCNGMDDAPVQKTPVSSLSLVWNRSRNNSTYNAMSESGSRQSKYPRTKSTLKRSRNGPSNQGRSEQRGQCLEAE